MMIKPDQVCRIVDHPRGGFHPTIAQQNALVRVVRRSLPPRCHLRCELAFYLYSLTDGELWDVAALQQIPEPGEPPSLLYPGDVFMMPAKNLAPLPDVDPEEEVPRETELNAQ